MRWDTEFVWGFTYFNNLDEDRESIEEKRSEEF